MALAKTKTSPTPTSATPATTSDMETAENEAPGASEKAPRKRFDFEGYWNTTRQVAVRDALVTANKAGNILTASQLADTVSTTDAFASVEVTPAIVESYVKKVIRGLNKANKARAAKGEAEKPLPAFLNLSTAPAVINLELFA